MARIIEWIDKRFPLSEFIEKHVTKYPTPKNLSYWWNFGSLAGADGSCGCKDSLRKRAS